MLTRHGALMLAAQLAFSLPISAQDHLEPEEGAFGRRSGWQLDYEKRLRGVLLEDGASYHLARMVCIPAFDPEWAVTVIREDGDGFDAPDSYFVEYANTGMNLSRSEGPQQPPARKLRVPIDRETAESLNRTWRLMLRKTRYPEEPRLGADGVGYHFSRSVPVFHRGQDDPLAGWEHGRIWSPEDDSPCRELVAIGERLRDYAQANPEDLDKIRSELRAMSDKLGAKLGPGGCDEGADGPGRSMPAPRPGDDPPR